MDLGLPFCYLPLAFPQTQGVFAELSCFVSTQGASHLSWPQSPGDLAVGEAVSWTLCPDFSKGKVRLMS